MDGVLPAPLGACALELGRLSVSHRFLARNFENREELSIRNLFFWGIRVPRKGILKAGEFEGEGERGGIDPNEWGGRKGLRQSEIVLAGKLLPLSVRKKQVEARRLGVEN